MRGIRCILLIMSIFCGVALYAQVQVGLHGHPAEQFTQRGVILAAGVPKRTLLQTMFARHGVQIQNSIV